MPPAKATATPLVLYFGDDDFAVQKAGKSLFARWSGELGGGDHEIIDATVSNSGEAMRSLSRLRESLQTLPFFGSGKAIWFQNCNFLADERSATTGVTESLSDLAQELKSQPWNNVRLLITATKVDRRKVFFKTLDKLGTVEAFAGLSPDAKDWANQAERIVRGLLQALSKRAASQTIAELVARVGPFSRQLESEVEKLALYTGSRETIEPEDVATVCVRNKNARAFALGDALGDRDLPRLLRRLDEELWEVRLDSQKSEIGVLYGLISKVRAMLLLKEMIREGWVRETGNFDAFKAQLEAIPKEQMPEDRRFNPLAINAFVLYKAFPQVKRYTQSELITAMELLLQCNQRLVTSGLDEAMVLQQALVKIVSPGLSGASSK